MKVIVARSQRDWGKREKLVLFSEAEEAADDILGVADDVRTFLLCALGILDTAIERDERLVVEFGRAVLWIGTVESFGKIPDSAFYVFLPGRFPEWEKLITEFSEQHGMVLIQNFLVVCR